MHNLQIISNVKFINEVVDKCLLVLEKSLMLIIV